MKNKNKLVEKDGDGGGGGGGSGGGGQEGGGRRHAALPFMRSWRWCFKESEVNL